MPAVIVIEANGTLKEQNARSVADTCAKAGTCQTQWSPTIGTKTYNISLYGKTTGRAGNENKYELPPPVDSVLYFGKCVIANTDGTNLKMSEWTTIYDHLFGGFEDLGTDEDEEDDEEDDPTENITKTGYAKDGFVVDDDEEEEEDEDYEPKKKTKAKAKAKPRAKAKAKVEVEVQQANICDEELEEEEYV